MFKITVKWNERTCSFLKKSIGARHIIVEDKNITKPMIAGLRLQEVSGSRLSLVRIVVFCLTACLYIPASLSAQSLSVFGVDASAFPVMKAKLYAYDAAGNQIYPRSTGDLILREDGMEKSLTRIITPLPVPLQPISAVLTIDVSGSMAGGSLQYAKAASRAWINALPLGTSECAVTTFNGKAYLNKDFTSDRKELLSTVELLTADGGTDYDAAFLQPAVGSLQVSKLGARQKKAIVFVSDGMPNNAPDENAIVSEAGRQGAAIYCVIMGSAAPQSVKNISDRTGGQWFENISSEAEATEIFRRILQYAQGGKPCEIEWSSEGCGNPRVIEVSLPGYDLKDKTSCEIPLASLPQIAYAPARSLHFGEVAPGKAKQIKFTLTAKGKPMRFEGIKQSDDRFRIMEYGGSSPPFTMGAGQSRELTIEFTPLSGDSSYAYCLFTIAGDACLGNTFYADAGWSTKMAQQVTVKLIRPNGGETFASGSDEVIAWGGVMPEEKVKLELSTNNGETWTGITDTANGLRYVWRVPETPGERCLVRVTAHARVTNFVGDMALIPAGSFRMGDITGNGDYSDEKPVHEVTISHPFLIGRTEVTQAAWKAVMGTNPSHFKGDNQPVEVVSWYDAIEFCNKLSKQEGLDPCYSGSGQGISCDFTANGYRLPTEAEWEYACRGGTETDYQTGNMTSRTGNEPVLNIVGWYDQNSGSQTHEVGLKQPNSFGLLDMHGNVWEWCWDWYSGTYYTANPITDPRGPATGSSRVLRGGSWDGSAYDCRSALRVYYSPVSRVSFVGFRVVRIY